IGSAQLIIDDLHEITGTRAEQALESFLTLRPRKIRGILGSRRPPRVNTSRMLVSGELIQLDGEDLRFRSWEVEQLFRTVYAAPLSPEAAAARSPRLRGRRPRPPGARADGQPGCNSSTWPPPSSAAPSASARSMSSVAVRG